MDPNTHRVDSMTTDERKEDLFKMWCAIWSATIHENGAHPDQPREPALRRARFEEWWDREGAHLHKEGKI